jgi:hypothetical protein
MDDQQAVFKGSFSGPDEAALHRGRRPVIFDILAPDQTTSLLDMVDEDLRLVLYVNPRSMKMGYSKQIERVQTRGGFVEFHWGDAAEEISFEAATGGFMRLYTGLSNITGSGGGSQGRRETIAYDKYLDLLALFHSNGAIYDAFGNIAVQGYIKLTFDGGSHIGWFEGDFSVTEEANSPFMFNLSTRFIIDKEIMSFRTANLFDFDAQAVGLRSGSSTPSPGAPSTAVLDPFADPFDPRTPGTAPLTGATTINPFAPGTTNPFRPGE